MPAAQEHLEKILAIIFVECFQSAQAPVHSISRTCAKQSLDYETKIPSMGRHNIFFSI